jgi:hypothetical protein
MSDEQKQVVPTPRPHIEIKKSVAGVLDQAGPRVREAVVTTLVDTQIDRRKSAILKAVEKLEAADKELKKLESKQPQAFDLEGKAIGAPTFSKEELGTIKQKREEIAKLEGALSKALADTPDFQKLFELVGEKNQGPNS